MPQACRCGVQPANSRRGGARYRACIFGPRPMWRWISIGLLAVVSCQRHTGGASGLEVDVEYAAEGTAGCVRLDITPAVGAPDHAEVSLAGKPSHGTVVFAVVREDSWSDDV